MNVMTHDEVMRGLQAGLTVAEQRGIALGLAVVDEGANLVGAVCMPGSGYPWICDEACGKAMSVVVWKGQPTGSLRDTAVSPLMTWLRHHYGNKLSYVKGGVPITRDGQLIGAAGAGGGPTDIDEEVAWAISHAIGD